MGTPPRAESPVGSEGGPAGGSPAGIDGGGLGTGGCDAGGCTTTSWQENETGGVVDIGGMAKGMLWATGPVLYIGGPAEGAGGVGREGR